eukprot:4104747-Pleurochrysis_carterae.AAC.1
MELFALARAVVQAAVRRRARCRPARRRSLPLPGARHKARPFSSWRGIACGDRRHRLSHKHPHACKKARARQHGRIARAHADSPRGVRADAAPCLRACMQHSRACWQVRIRRSSLL